VKSLWQFLGLAERDSEDLLADEVEDVEHPPATVTTVIGPGVSVKGELRGEGALTLLGQFEGEVVLNGAVRVGSEARVDANITASEIVIAGAVRGNLSAAGRVEILPSGSLTGSLKSGSLSAGTGSTVKGEVWVEPTPEARPAPLR
jgi:cytoskeletal protein CcmA (bactofilin family)